eukprot:2964052-Pyramimonas_sp.AAC.1
MHVSPAGSSICEGRLLSTGPVQYSAGPVQYGYSTTCTCPPQAAPYEGAAAQHRPSTVQHRSSTVRVQYNMHVSPAGSSICEGQLLSTGPVQYNTGPVQYRYSTTCTSEVDPSLGTNPSRFGPACSGAEL